MSNNYLATSVEPSKPTMEQAIFHPITGFIVIGVFTYALIRFSVSDLTKRVESLEKSREKDKIDEHTWLEEKLKTNNEILLGDIKLQLSELRHEIKQANELGQSRNNTLNELKSAVARIGEDARDAKSNANLAVKLSCGNPPSNP